MANANSTAPKILNTGIEMINNAANVIGHFKQWCPVVVLDAGIQHGIQSGLEVRLEPVSDEEEAEMIALSAYRSNPKAIGFTVKRFKI